MLIWIDWRLDFRGSLPLVHVSQQIHILKGKVLQKEGRPRFQISTNYQRSVKLGVKQFLKFKRIRISFKGVVWELKVDNVEEEMLVDVTSVRLEDLGRWRTNWQFSLVNLAPVKIVLAESGSQLVLSLFRSEGHFVRAFLQALRKYDNFQIRRTKLVAP